jgi:hypothetical protein
MKQDQIVKRSAGRIFQTIGISKFLQKHLFLRGCIRKILKKSMHSFPNFSQKKTKFILDLVEFQPAQIQGVMLAQFFDGDADYRSTLCKSGHRFLSLSLPIVLGDR